MTIEDIILSDGIWRYSQKADNGIVLKSTILMRRNLKDCNFMNRLSKAKAARILDEIKDAIIQEDYCSEYSVFNIEEFDKIEKKVLEERDILNEKESGRYLVIANDEKSYFILGAEDQIVLHVNSPGNDFEDIYVFGDQILSELGKSLKFAFLPHFGYLTANPKYAGPGFQMVMTCHLIGLSTAGTLNEIISDLKREGFKIRGSWINDFYSIYKETTLGFTDREIYEKSVDTFKRVVELEKAARERIYSINKESIEDKVWRSIGILKSARIITLFEALDLISKVRFGINLGILNKPTLKDLNKLLYFIQDGHLIKRNKLSDDYSKDKSNSGLSLMINENRANLIREYLKEVA